MQNALTGRMLGFDSSLEFHLQRAVASLGHHPGGGGAPESDLILLSPN